MAAYVLFASLATAIGWSCPARAADMRLGKNPEGKAVIAVSGVLDLGDDEKFARLAADAEDAAVYLSGPGGSTLAAVGIGTAIRLRGWETVVPRDASCASACALIWVAGSRRSVGMDGRVGFHASYVVKDGQPFEAGAGNALVGAYLNKLGLRDRAVLFMTSAPPDSIAWLKPEDAASVGIAARFDTSDVMPGAAPSTVAGNPVPPSATVPPLVPGAEVAPTPLPDSRMMAALYRGFPASLALGADRPCVRQQCSLTVNRIDAWTGTDGKPRRLFVGVAEVGDGCHACTAVVGVAIFRWDFVAWVPERLVPAAVAAGSFGSYRGKVDVLHLDQADPVLVLHGGDMHFGEVDEDATILMPVLGGFKQVLQVATSHYTGGSCDPKEGACRKRMRSEDYSSTVAVAAAPGGGLAVVQSFANGTRKAVSWQVGPDGRATPGGPGTARLAQAAAPANAASLAAGAANRRAYEAWFAGLSGDERDGAAFWAGQRSLRNPPACEAAKPATPQGIAGCAGARRMLAPMDARRKGDASYRQGWNGP